MPSAVVLVDEVVSFRDGRYIARVRVLKVSKGVKFPDGYKVRCVLIDRVRDTPVLLLDNHHPFGYHIHTRLPKDKSERVVIAISSYVEAIEAFMDEAKRLIDNEK